MSAKSPPSAQLILCLESAMLITKTTIVDGYPVKLDDWLPMGHDVIQQWGDLDKIDIAVVSARGWRTCFSSGRYVSQTYIIEMLPEYVRNAMGNVSYFAHKHDVTFRPSNRDLATRVNDEVSVHVRFKYLAVYEGKQI